MRGVGGEVRQLPPRRVKARQQAVHLAHQRRHLGRQASQRHGRQLVGAARGQLAAQLPHRHQCAAHHPPHDQHQERRQQRHRQHRGNASWPAMRRRALTACATRITWVAVSSVYTR
ncbi:MAG: hypothetical protein R3E52_06670 [Burkholderiaceae bacterium]